MSTTPQHQSDADVDVRNHRPLGSRSKVNADVREVTRGGREYLVFPIIALREMVIDYPENGTRELLARERLHESEHLWAGTPLTFIHPENEQKTADKPESYVREVIGQVFQPEVVDDEKLKVQAWLDIEKARDLGGLAEDVVSGLQAGENLSVSAGYATIDDHFVTGTHDGDEYDVEQGMILPDHVAVFPSGEFQARCDWEDGCGAPRVNYVAAPSDLESQPKGECSDGSCSCGMHLNQSEGDIVVWETANVYGRIVDTIGSDQTYDGVVGDQAPVEGPAALFEIHEFQSGEWQSTGTMRAAPLDELDDLNGFPTNGPRSFRTNEEAESTENAHDGIRPGDNVQWRGEEGERNFGLVREVVSEPNSCREINDTVRCATEDRNVLIVERQTETGDGLQEYHLKFEDAVDPWTGGHTAAGTAMNADEESGVTDTTDDSTDMTDQDSDPATHFQRFMESLGLANGPRENASSTDETGDTSEEDGDDAPATDDADTVENAEDGGAEESTQDSDTGDTMPDDDTTTNQQNLTVEDLAEHTMFSVETLEEMGEDMLEQLEQDVIAELLGSGEQPSGEGEGSSGGSGEEQQANAEDSTDNDNQEEQTVTNSDDDGSYVTEEQLDSRLDSFEERVTNSIGETVEAKLEDFSEQQKENAETEKKARVVANAVDGLSVEGAKSLPSDELDSLFEKHNSGQRANMAAVPGEMNRNFEEPDDDGEYQDYPGGSRSEWQKRNAEQGGDD